MICVNVFYVLTDKISVGSAKNKSRTNFLLTLNLKYAQSFDHYLNQFDKHEYQWCITNYVSMHHLCINYHIKAKWTFSDLDKP